MTATRTVADTIPLTGSVGIDVTGATLEVHATLADGTTLSEDAEITDAATGAFTMAWPTGGVPNAPGAARGIEVQITFGGGEVQTVTGDRLYIRRQLA